MNMKFLQMKNDWNLNKIGVKTDLYLRNLSSKYIKIYSVGSKNTKRCVGIGIFISKCLLDQLSDFTAEMMAVISIYC